VSAGPGGGRGRAGTGGGPGRGGSRRADSWAEAGASAGPPPPWAVAGDEGETAVGAVDEADGEPQVRLGGESDARRIALDALSRAARTRGQLEALLQRKDVAPEAADAVLDRFEELGLIDDAGYAQAFVESRHRVRGQGGRALTAELRRRGVADEVVAEAVGALDPDVEFETACRLARSRHDRMSGLAPEVRVRRLAGFLARKGYSGAVVARAVRHAIDTARDQAAADETAADETAADEAAAALDGFAADEAATAYESD
jgi:regulatory protein